MKLSIKFKILSLLFIIFIFSINFVYAQNSNDTISDIKIVVKSKMTSYIQEAHMSILHCICECLDKELK